MLYHDIYQLLKSAYSQKNNKTDVPELGITLSHYPFTSGESKNMLPGSSELFCDKHNHFFDEVNRGSDSNSVLDLTDHEIVENNNFRYTIVHKTGQEKANGTIILLHGLNEKNWDKYLPWAYRLTQDTGKAVILFPIAFHMDRAPEAWSDRKLMFAVADEREKRSKDNTQCSYVNAAISSRMDANPQRLFWSGMQTYSDIIKLANAIKANEIPQISPVAGIDLFGYSIGSFLALILMMGNPQNIFANSRLFCFCGGMTIDRMFPVSRYIMDAHAAVTMQKSFAQFLNSNFASDDRLAHYQNTILHPEESWFKTMVRYNHFQKERESRFNELAGRIKVVVLEKDEVAPPAEALNTLKGGYRNINVQVDIRDFNHPYTHMVPFPATQKFKEEIDESYTTTMGTAAVFLM
jgi:predicted esterase